MANNPSSAAIAPKSAEPQQGPPAMGGGHFVFEGHCARGATSRAMQSGDRAGEVVYSCEVAYWGGKQYLRIDEESAHKIKPNSWVKLKAGLKQFKDTCYPDIATVVECRPL